MFRRKQIGSVVYEGSILDILDTAFDIEEEILKRNREITMEKKRMQREKIEYEIEQRRKRNGTH